MPSPTSGLFLKADGTWLHDGDLVGHERLCALLHRSIARDAEGNTIVTTGRDVLPFACEDTPLRVLSASVAGDTVRLRLSNEREEALDPPTLRVDSDGSWRCVTSQLLDARFTRAAQLQLMDFVEEVGAGYVLRIADRTLPLVAA